MHSTINLNFTADLINGDVQWEEQYNNFYLEQFPINDWRTNIIFHPMMLTVAAKQYTFVFMVALNTNW